MLGELFDPRADLSISEHFRPHCSQAGAIVFITFRTHDSIPQQVLQRWEREKQDWIERRGHVGRWSNVLPTLDSREQNKFKTHFNRCREDLLDQCQGECVLRQPELAKIVADSLLYFDGDRYRMGDFVVMLNHAHLLASVGSGERPNSQKSDAYTIIESTIMLAQPSLTKLVRAMV